MLGNGKVAYLGDFPDMVKIAAISVNPANFQCSLNHLSVEYYLNWFILSEIGDYLDLGFQDQILQLPKCSTPGPETKFIFTHNE